MGTLEILLVLILLSWLGGFGLLHLGGLVHLLLVVFVVVLIVRLLQGRPV